MKAIIIFVCFLLGFVLSEKSEDTIPVQLIVFRSNPNETFYEDSIYKLDVAKNFNWIFTNSTPACTTSLYKCACDELETVAGKAKHREMIIFVVEDLDVDSICTYTAHTNSPILLQIFHVQKHDHAIISLSSPAGRLHYEVPQQNFSHQILNVFSIMKVNYDSSLLNPNTLPKTIIVDPKLLHGMLKKNQENIETGNTPIGYIHFGFGLIIIVIAMISGFLSVDHYPFFDYRITLKSDMTSI